MSNPTTAAEWKQVAANAQAQIGAVNQQKAQGEEQITALEQQLLANGQQISDYLIANPRITSRDSGLLALQAQTDTIKQNLSKTEVYVRATLTSQLFQLRATINNANTQANVASTGAPNTNENTPPETVVPNQSNTTVTTETPPPVQNFAPPTEPVIPAFPQRLATPPIFIQPQVQADDTPPSSTFTPPPIDNTVVPVVAPDVAPVIIQNAIPPATGQTAADAAFQEANASPQQFIDPNSDPNTNIGVERQTPAGQKPINPNSDPNTNIGAEIQTIENASPRYINETYVTAELDAAAAAAAEADAEFGPTPDRTEQDVIDTYGGMRGLQGSVDRARAQQITQDAENAKTQGDWRVRLSLAPGASYLYKAQNPGILEPLQKTDGVIFPYVPSIQVTYAAHYDPAELTHSNYKIYQYKSSSVDQISITCDFTAQDNEEANYLLAVIHFFRSVTKMFYGQDEIPKPGTPPPLCYLSGMGDFQFDRHPLVISSFNYSLPTDVDYIRAASPTLLSGVNSTGYNDNRNSDLTPRQGRLEVSRLQVGATKAAPNFSKATNTQPTYVPTKIQLSVSCYPIVTRNDISNNFSLAKYATGALLQGRKNPGGGGIW